MQNHANKVEICGVNTAKLTVLSAEEKEKLLTRSCAGDREARTQLIDGNLKLVLSVIKKFTNRGENLDDIFQVGCIGLIKAIDNFDMSVGVKFSTYAVPMIIGEIRRYLRDNNPIRVSRSMRDLAYRALQAKEELTSAEGHDVSFEQIAERLGADKYDVVCALESIVDPLSLYEPAYGDGGDSVYVMDQISDEENIDDMWLDQISLKHAIRKLTAREKKILGMRFFQGKTQMEVSDEIGISQAQVSRLEKNALQQIKKQFV